METQTRKTDSSTMGLVLLRELFDNGLFVFTTKQARYTASRLGMSEGYVSSQLLTRLVETGLIVRLRRGLYAGTGELLGATQIHPFVIATHLVTPSAISHLSAMNYHRLTDQVPLVVSAFTPKKVYPPSIRRGAIEKSASKHVWKVQGISYEYVTVKRKFFFGIEEIWVDQNFRVPITDRERTMLEGFVTPRMFGGIGEILGILDDYLGEFDLEKLVTYALRYGKASVAKRLGWALARAGAPVDVLLPLEGMPVSGYRMLDPTRPRTGPCDRRWKIQNNLAGLKR